MLTFFMNSVVGLGLVELSAATEEKSAPTGCKIVELFPSPLSTVGKLGVPSPNGRG